VSQLLSRLRYQAAEDWVQCAELLSRLRYQAGEDWVQCVSCCLACGIRLLRTGYSVRAVVWLAVSGW
jgi:hypothetical protein